MAEYSFRKWNGLDGWAVRGWDVGQVVFDQLDQVGHVTVTVDKRDGSSQEVELIGILHEDRKATIFEIKPKPKPKAKTEANEEIDPDLEPGFYETDDGIFVVKPNQDKTRLYAKRMVELTVGQGDRTNDEGDVLRFEFEYESGAVFKLKPSDRMDLERAKELAIRYGRCINCGRKLEVKESVERGIGPVCAKQFRVTPPDVEEILDEWSSH